MIARRSFRRGFYCTAIGGICDGGIGCGIINPPMVMPAPFLLALGTIHHIAM